MPKLMRFGRRIALPSTCQIRHELLVMMQEDQRRLAEQAGEVKAPFTPPGAEPPASTL